MRESELFEPVKEWLLKVVDCTNVYGEVLDADVFGINGPSNVIVELKPHLSFKVLEQAYKRLKYAHYVYVAIPKPKKGLAIPFAARQFLLMHRIGLLYIKPPYAETSRKKGKNEEDRVMVRIPARFQRVRKRNRDNIRNQIRSYSEAQIGGVKSGERVTDYSITIKNIQTFLRQKKDWITVDDILEHCETHYKNPKPSVYATLKAKWNESWCETKTENRKRFFRYRMPST